MSGRKFATPKTASPAPEAAGRRFAVAKPKPPQSDDFDAWPDDDDAAPLDYRGAALQDNGDGTHRWACRFCDGVIRDDGIGAHQYTCRYWRDNPDATPF